MPFLKTQICAVRFYRRAFAFIGAQLCFKNNNINTLGAMHNATSLLDPNVGGYFGHYLAESAR